MKNLLIVLIPIFCISSCIAQSSIQYHLINENPYEPQGLRATADGKEYILINTDEEICMGIEQVTDFNNDGYKDALIKVINACGGNGAGDSYMLLCFDGEKFRRTKSVGYDWDGIEVIKTGEDYRFVIQTTNAGVGNTDMCSDKEETYSLKEYELELVNVVEQNKLNAVKEIKSSDFIGKSDEEQHLYYDLDGDGKTDKITCSYWERWGSLFNLKISFGNGKSYDISGTPKRVGVLKTKTNNVYDLVFDCDKIVKWNGSEYINGE